MKALLTLAAVLLTTAAFWQDVAGVEVAEVVVEDLVYGVYTYPEAQAVIGKLFVTFVIAGILSIPLIATWDSEVIPTIARALFWVPAVVAIISIIAIIVLWFGMIFVPTPTA